METMNLQDLKFSANEGIAFRAVSSVLLLTATALLVGSLITAHSVNTSPNSDRVTTEKVT
jgi:tetrahydromethanopterin S-methyltransferase subunit D